MRDRDEGRDFIGGEIDDDVTWRRIVERAARDLDPGDPRNAAYFEWLAAELRESETPEERAAIETRAAIWCERHFARHGFRRLRMRLSPGLPHTRRIGEARSLEAMLASDVRRTLGRVAAVVDAGAAAGAGRDIMDEAVTEFIELPPELPPGRYVALWVAGTSMAPLLHDGDRILVELGVAPSVDTVVVARTEDLSWIVKRVRAVDESFLELDSLNPEFAPLVLNRADTEVLGRVVLRWCPHDV